MAKSVVVTNPKKHVLLKMLRDTKKILDDKNIIFWLEAGTLLGVIRDGDFIPWEKDIDIGCWKTDQDYSIKQKLKKAFQQIGYTVFMTDGHLNIRPIDDLEVWLDINFYERGEDDEAVTLGPSFNSSLNKISQIINHQVLFLYNKKNYLKRLRIMFTPVFSLIYSLFVLLPPFLKENVIKGLVAMRDGLSKTSKLTVKTKYIDNLQSISVFNSSYNIPGFTEDYLRDGYGNDWRTPKKDWDWENLYGFIQ